MLYVCDPLLQQLWLLGSCVLMCAAERDGLLVYVGHSNPVSGHDTVTRTEVHKRDIINCVRLGQVHCIWP